MDGNPPIIIVKKKTGHGAHHGSAWKVAYADFVTAMMALFLVLWLLSSSVEVQKAVGGYFLDPSGHANLRGSSVAGTGEALEIGRDDLDHLKDKIEDAMQSLREFPEIKDQVTFVVTGEGLRIELLENDKGTFFQSGSASPTPAGQELLRSLAREIGSLDNHVLIEGHTDSKPFSGGSNYSNWELSADRANAARRVMEATGLKPDQVTQVRGFADQNLLRKDAPEHASNRRVSVVIRYRNYDVSAPSVPPGAAAPSAPPSSSAPAAAGH
jgi:chemotaxis protein MotB